MNRQTITLVSLVAVAIAVGFVWNQCGHEPRLAIDKAVTLRVAPPSPNVRPPEPPPPVVAPKTRLESESEEPVLTKPAPLPVAKVTVSGKVVDSSDRPVSGADVDASGCGVHGDGPAQSGADGRFELTDLLPCNELTLTASKDEMVNGLEGPMPLPSGGLSGVTLRLQGTGSVEGRVLSSTGRPIAKALVRADAPESTRSGSMGKTNTQGAFVIKRLLPGTYALYVDLPGSTQGSITPSGEVEVLAGQKTANVELVMEEGGKLSISGHITDATGAPVAGATVDVESSRFSRRVRADDTGAYKVDGLREGKYDVIALHVRHGMWEVQGVQAGSTDVDLALPGLSAIEGRVLEAATGKPIVDFEVASTDNPAHQVNPWYVRRYVEVHNDKGRFLLKDLQAGTITVIARAPGFIPNVQSVGPVAGNETKSGIELSLVEGRHVTGAVSTADGQPVNGAFVYVGTTDPGRKSEYGAAARSAEDGTFGIAGLSDADTAITVSAPHYAPVTVSIRPGANSSISVVLGHGGVLEGTVTQGDAPISGQKITVQYDGATNASEKSTTTGAQGTYRLAGLPPGKVYVCATFRPSHRFSPSYRTHSLEAVIEDGKAATVDFEFPAEDAVIRGEVTRDGAPARVELRAHITTADGAEEHLSAQTGEHGQYRIERVPQGEVTLIVRNLDGPNNTYRAYESLLANRFYQTTAIANQTTEFNIAISGGGSVAGVVRSLRPNQSCYVEAYRGSGDVSELRHARNSLVGHTDVERPSGTFRFDDLQAGTYTLLARVFEKSDQNGTIDRTKDKQATCVVQVVDGRESATQIVLQ